MTWKLVTFCFPSIIYIAQQHAQTSTNCLNIFYRDVTTRRSITITFFIYLGIKESKLKLGLTNLKNQREQIEPLKDRGPAIRATLHVEEIDSAWGNVENINFAMTQIVNYNIRRQDYFPIAGSKLTLQLNR